MKNVRVGGLKFDLKYLVCLSMSLSSPADSGSFANIDLKSVGGTAVTIRVYSVPLREARIRVLYVPDHQSRGRRQARSLDDIASDLQRKLPDRPWSIISGGFYLDPQTPNGLLRVNGRWKSSLNRMTTTSSCEGKTRELPRLSGVLCSGPTQGEIRILRALDSEVGRCIDAVQAGPLLIEPDGSNGICRDEPKRTRPSQRTAICISADQVKLFISELPINLRDLSEAMAKQLGCSVALNLSGDRQAGLLIYDPLKKEVASYGTTNGAMASAIVLEERR